MLAIDPCAHLRQLVQELYVFRDTYLSTSLDGNLFSGKESDVIKLLKPQNVDLQKHLTELIRNVAEAFNSKPDLIQDRLDKVLRAADQCESSLTATSFSDMAQLYYLRGRAFNVLSAEETQPGQSQAKSCLLKALKLDPNLSDAWCELAEVSWMEGDPESAIAPLRSALKHDPKHSESLWRLSMLLRQLHGEDNKKAKEALLAPSPDAADVLNLLPPLDATSFPSCLTENTSKDPSKASTTSLLLSVRLAHAAVKAAPTNGRAWECLGNALLTTFLTGSPSSDALVNRCLAAFAQAARDPCVAMAPHFHYNRGVACHYQDKFSEAIVSWFRASLLDPAWPAPRTYVLRLTSTLRRIADEMAGVGATAKARRRLQELIQPLAACLKVCRNQAVPSSGNSGEADETPRRKVQKSTCAALTRLLGPFFNEDQLADSSVAVSRQGRPKTLSASAELLKCQLRLFNDLQTGSNVGSVCCGRVVTSLPSDSDLVLNLLCVDAEGSLMVLRIYHIGKGVGPVVKDVLAIPDPYVEECNVSADLLRLVLTFDACTVAEGAGGNSESDDADDDGVVNSPALSSALQHLSDIHLRLIRVPTPSVLCVNGRRIGRSWTAPVVLKNVFFTCV
uniref:Tetratricopeptide repeat protein 5 n=1 Tax=Schistocephalus solidus TaxID=70667 RepID=A0A0V0J5Y9_SCHSO